MSKLYEHLDADEMSTLVGFDVTDALDVLSTARQLGGASKKNSYSLIPETAARKAKVDPDTVNEPIVRAIHTAMFHGASPDTRAPAPYTYVWRGYVRDITEALWPSLAPGQITTLTNSVTRAMRYHKLAAKAGPGPTRQYWMAPWSPSVHILTGTPASARQLTEAEEARLETRIEEEKGTPVDASYSLGHIPIPDPMTPDGAIEYITKLVNVFGHVRKALREERERNADLETQVRDLTAKLEEIGSSEWAKASQQIRDLVSGDGDGDESS